MGILNNEHAACGISMQVNIGQEIGGRSITQEDVDSGKMVVQVQHYKFDLSSLEDDSGVISAARRRDFERMSRADKEKFFPLVPMEEGEMESISGGRVRELDGVSVHVVDSAALALGTKGYAQNEFARRIQSMAGTFVAGDAHGKHGESIIGAEADAMEVSDMMFDREQRISNLSHRELTNHGGCNSCGTCPASGTCGDEDREKTVENDTNVDGFVKEEKKRVSGKFDI